MIILISFLLISFSSPQLFAKINDFKDNIRFYAKKSVSKSSGNEHWLYGDVIINQDKQTLYGQEAYINLEKGIYSISGNVRLVTDQMTVYSSSMSFDEKNGQVVLSNARINNSDFSLVAKELRRISSQEYLAMEAEFTTCLECDNSWKIYGDKIQINVGEYARITNAIFRVKDVPVIYLPYFVVPIKNKRQSGFLFPQFSRTQVISSFELLVPWFWAIDKDKDLTITPSYWGRRGFGIDLQARYKWNNLSNLEINSRSINDRIYDPVNSNRTDIFRTYLDSEAHFQKKLINWAHVNFDHTSDLDFTAAQSFYTERRILGSELTKDITLHHQTNSLFFDFKYSKYQNLLYQDPLRRDPFYVDSQTQFIASTKSFHLTPWLSLGGKIQSDIFSSKEQVSNNFLDKYNRTMMTPWVKLHFNKSRFYSLQSEIELPFHHYSFPDQNSFNKSAILTTSKFSTHLSRTYGNAKIEESEIAVEKVEDQNYLGQLPKYDDREVRKQRLISRSFKHAQEFNLIHHGLMNVNNTENHPFYNQINEQVLSNDYNDTLWDNRHLLSGRQFRKEVPLDNTLELQWNNSIIEKTPNDTGADYLERAFFNISQGFYLDKKDQEGRLTRLKLESQFNWRQFALNLSQYYFHATRENIFDINLSSLTGIGKFRMGVNIYDIKDEPLKTLYMDGQIPLLNVLALRAKLQYDLLQNQRVINIYEVEYFPVNHCWSFLLNYRDSVIDQRISFNLELNFGNKNFGKFIKW